MTLYTQRNGIGTKIENSSVITYMHYKLLYECCTRYYTYLGYMHPIRCDETNDLIGLNRGKFELRLCFKIPDLYRNILGELDVPELDFSGKYDEFNTYSVLDLIEYVGSNIKDYEIIDHHPYKMHEHIRYLETNDCRRMFRDEINEIFDFSNLQYIMNGDYIIERVLKFEILDSNTKSEIIDIEEDGIRTLLDKANMLYKSANALNRTDALEKIWDAFERIKSFYNHSNKNESTEILIKKMCEGNKNISEMLEIEFRVLTAIGNNYRIRHHEMNKYDIENTNQVDYLYNRILSLIIFAIKYL